MKKILKSGLSTVLSLALAVGCVNFISKQNSVDASTDYTQFFQKDTVIDINISLPDNDFQDMLDNAMDEEYHSADITIDGTTVSNIGFRTKGNLTLRSVAGSDSNRYSYRIKFNEYVKGQKLLGLDELVLNNMYSDPSYLREYLTYEALSQAGAVTPKTVFANLYVNGELQGLYLCVEAIDDTFLKENFGSNDGNLYKAEQGSTLVYKENSDYESLELKNGDDESKTGLKNFIQTLNNLDTSNYKEIENILDVDSALSYIALNYVFGNPDSYNGNMAQNYYLYELDGKFSVIPWDFNMTFGTQGNSNVQDLFNPIMGGGRSSGDSQRPLITKLLSIPEYQEKYLNYIKIYVNYLSNIETRISEIAPIIRPYIEADPTKFFTLEDFESSITYNENESSQSFEDMAQRQTPPEFSETGANMPGIPMGDFSQMPNQSNFQQGDTPNGFRQDQGMPLPPDMQEMHEQGTNMPEMPIDNNSSQRPGKFAPPQGESPTDFRQDQDAPTPPDMQEMSETTMHGARQGFINNGDRDNATSDQDSQNFNHKMGGMGQKGGSIVNFARKTVAAFNSILNDNTGYTDNSDFQIYINNHLLNTDTQPILINDRLLVPIRAISEELGFDVDYDNSTKTVSVSHDKIDVSLEIDNPIVKINGQEITIDVSPIISNNRTLVPLRFISEAFGKTVNYTSETKTIEIN